MNYFVVFIGIFVSFFIWGFSTAFGVSKMGSLVHPWLVFFMVVSTLCGLFAGGFAAFAIFGPFKP